MRMAKILKEFTERENVKPSNMANDLGLASSSMSDLMNGKILGKEVTIKSIIKYLKLSKDEELEVWKAWSLDRSEPKAAAYFEKLNRENKKLKKILATIKEL